MKLPALRNTDVHTRLSIYLNDHLGASVGAIELARRLHRSNEGTLYESPLEGIVQQIEEDVASLRDVMARLGVEEDGIKQASARVFERVGRLKLNGQLLGYSSLSRLVELEGLVLGVTGKVGMWLVLNDNYGQDARLSGVDLPGLLERAREQRATLEGLRRRSAGDTLR